MSVKQNNIMVYLRKHIDIVLIVFSIIGYTIVLSYFSILRHNAFVTSFDLGNMDQTIWNTLYGHFFTLTTPEGQQSRFHIHADIILAFLAPLYLIKEDVRMILILQSFAIGLGALPTYLIAHKILKQKVIAFGFVILYFLNFGLQWANLYDFHAVTLALPLLLFCFYFMLEKKWKLFFISAGIAFLTKENVPLIVLVYGFINFFVFKERKIGFITTAISLGYFLGIMFVVIPYFSSLGHHWALAWIQYEGAASSGVAYVPSYKLLFDRLKEPMTVEYITFILKQIGFLPLLGFPWIILSSPQLLIALLSKQGQMRSIYYHYDVLIVQGLMIASIYGVYYFKAVIGTFMNKTITRFGTYIIVVIAILLAGRFYYFYNPLPLAPACWCYIFQVTDEDRAFDALLQEIPESAVVSASPEIRPHITHREFAYTLPVATDSADFVAIIDQNRMVGNYESKDFELRLIDILNASDAYRLKEQIGHFYLYEKTQ